MQKYEIPALAVIAMSGTPTTTGGQGELTHTDKGTRAHGSVKAHTDKYPGTTTMVRRQVSPEEIHPHHSSVVHNLTVVPVTKATSTGHAMWFPDQSGGGSQRVSLPPDDNAPIESHMSGLNSSNT